jgi:ribokinase
MAPGGKGANQAVQCARLGADVTMIGCVGGDVFGQQLLDTARASGVDLSHVKVDPTISSGIGHILLETTAHGVQNRITVIPGANQSLVPEDVAWVHDRIREYDMVMLQMEIPLEINLCIARWARGAGVPVMLNPAPAAPLNSELLTCVDYLTPNEQEAAVETGCPLYVGKDGISPGCLEAVAASLGKTGVEHIIVTLGALGVGVILPDGIQRFPAVKIPAVADPTAAGDSFVAALCIGLCIGLEQEQALVFASHAAAITVSRMGAMPSLPRLDEVIQLLRKRDCAALDFARLDALRELSTSPESAISIQGQRLI